ncbi:MAG: hypothetical protein QXV16_01350, partial [Candidatus Anstonellales archaeon]
MYLLILGLLIVLSSAEWDVLVMWNKTFNEAYGYDDRGYSIIKSDDGGYVIVGWSYQGTNEYDVWVIKIDEN